MACREVWPGARVGRIPMDDITIIYITANEMPIEWIDFQLSYLKAAIGEKTPTICITRNSSFVFPFSEAKYVLDNNQKSYWNIYHQLLIGAKLAKTKYIATAEDDVLYTSEHFKEFRPKNDEVSYDRSRWSLFAWESNPIYCLRNRISNCSLIAPREYLIDALEEREKKWPNGFERDDLVGEVGRKMVENNLGVSRRNMVEWYSTNAIVQLNHINGTDDRQKTKWKKHGQIKAYDIPYWGKAKEIVNVYDNA